MSLCKNNKKNDNCCKKQNVQSESNEICQEKVKDNCEDYMICTCMDVMYFQLIEEINNGSDTLQKLPKALGIGTRCSSCVDEVEEIIAQKLKINKKV